MKTSQATKNHVKPVPRRSRRTPPDGTETTPRKPLSREEYMVQFRAEEKSFLAQRKHLMKKHPEALYVAIWHGTPVVFGQTFIDVAVQYHASFGDDPVYIGKLSDEPDVEYMSGLIPE